MRDLFAALLSRYGQQVRLTRRRTGEEVSGRAFLQPVLRRTEEAPAATPLGAVSEQRWLYIGGGAQPLAPGDRVDSGALRLVVREARPIYLGDELVYHWALLRRRKEAAE